MIQGETVTSGAKNPHLSAFQVLQSAAGFYVGTLYTHDDCPQCQEEGLPAGFQEPGSRETGYFQNRAAAERALAELLAGETPPELRTEEFNREFPPGATAEDIYRALHPTEFDPNELGDDHH